MITYITLALVVSFVIGALWKYFDSRNWIETTGVINSIELIEEYNRPLSSSSAGRNFTDYKINLSYQFTLQDRVVKGSQFYPLIPNVFTEQKYAQEMLDKYKANQQTIIYYNPSNPNDSCLITSKDISTTKVILFSFIVISFMTATIMGILFFLKNF